MLATECIGLLEQCLVGPGAADIHCIPADSALMRDVLETMGRYGEILEHEVGRGNWLFLRYATKWQAEKALAQSAIVLDGAAGPVVVGALRLTPDVAARFGMHSARGEAQPAAAPPAAPAIKTKSDLMLHPKLRASQLKRRGCCEKLMAFLFSV